MYRKLLVPWLLAIYQQHFFCFWFLLFKLKLCVLFDPSYFSLTIRANVINTFYTFSPVFTEVDIYFKLCSFAHFVTSDSFTFLYKSLLFPTSIIIALYAFSLHKSYHCSTAFLNEDYRDWSKTRTTPWQPLKQVDTIDLYFYWPAVSQIYSLANLLCRLIFLILKSIVVTCVYF